MCNVLEKLHSDEPLTDRERATHEAGLVSVLRQIHDDLDAAVADAYGWSHDLRDEEILARLVALNAERAREEQRGVIRWLRPEFQNPAGASQAALDTGQPIETPAASVKREKQPWPPALADQARAVRQTLVARGVATTAAELARAFSRARVERVEELLETLVSLGQARRTGDGRFVA